MGATIPRRVRSMVGTRTSRLLRRLRTAAGSAGEDATDARLLERYVASRDDPAFAAIVRRHGPLVWGVCRRLLADHQDAEDAFQATFLVLARKAAGVVPRHLVGNWLHGVARRTALKARALAARRRRRECPVADVPERETSPPDAWADVRGVIDEELARLPPRFRAVVLLCDLEGKTRAQAARQLGVPAGTVAGWLWRARAVLAKRLSRRGVSLSGASLAAGLVQYEASATVPASVVSRTVGGAAGTLGSGAVRAPVATLTQGVLHSMWLSKLRAVLAVVVAAGVLGTAVTGLAIHAAAGEESKPKAPADPKGDKPVADRATDPPDLLKIKQEVDRLRAELDALKKQVGAAPAAAPTPKDDSEPVLAIRIYPVAALMSDRDKDDSLVRVITNTVRPASWSMQGGPGTVEYFAAGKSLVVNQTEDVHTQIDKLLAELTKVKETQDARPAKK
jgi:RNA polymerase sigma factor (sigma-70 family)